MPPGIDNPAIGLTGMSNMTMNINSAIHTLSNPLPHHTSSHAHHHCPLPAIPSPASLAGINNLHMSMSQGNDHHDVPQLPSLASILYEHYLSFHTCNIKYLFQFEHQTDNISLIHLNILYKTLQNHSLLQLD